MKKTREQAIICLVDNGIFTEKECEEEDGGKFYVNGLVNGADICDLDRYAWLNTLFQYDITFDKAMEIDSWLWGSETILKDYPLGYETLEIEWDNEKDKELLKKCNDELNLGLDFSKWITYDPVAYMYF